MEFIVDDMILIEEDNTELKNMIQSIGFSLEYLHKQDFDKVKT